MAMQKPPPDDAAQIDRLIAVMAALRNPDGGCPWDLQQDFASIAPYTIEEAYEVSDAITRGNFTDLRDELGDLLLQVVFHGRMAEEAGHFDFAAIAQAITDKMIRRHPHVFAGHEECNSASQTRAWEDQKAFERQEKSQQRDAGGEPGRDPGVLADVALALPALMRAEKLQKRAARIGFDWPDAEPVFAKLDEEIGELRAALALPDDVSDGNVSDGNASDGSGNPKRSDQVREAQVREEVGDLLFTLVNMARKLKVDPEMALRQANDKFTQRFQYIEKNVRASGKVPENMKLEELEALWQAAKLENIKQNT